MYTLVGVSAELAEQLVAIEANGEDAVHQARTRVRRLRGILSVYKKAFDREADRRMRARLKRLGTRLGEVRDLEVRIRALEDAIAFVTNVPSDGSQGHIRDESVGVEGAGVEGVDAGVVDAVESLAAQARERYDRASDDLLRLLRSRGHRELMADLQRFAADPPLTGAGRSHQHRVTGTGLKKAAKRVRRSVGTTLEECHETRKAARRLRYAAEAVIDDLGREAIRIAAAAEAVHHALGDHRDFVLLARHLRETATGAEITARVARGLTGLAEEYEGRAEEQLDGLDEKLGAIEP
jgi:CHAD domain-containing protein